LINTSDELHHLTKLAGGIHTLTEAEFVLVLEEVTSEEHALLLIAQEGDRDGELGQFLELTLLVALLPLLHLDGDVVVGLRVVEGEYRTTSGEELRES